MLTERTELFRENVRVLHFAPELGISRRLRGAQNIDYVTADLYADGVDLRINITDSGLPAASFDVILCSHVLEHIHDDRAAMAEILRLLRPDGWAFLVVPFNAGLSTTYEDESITNPEDRAREFGQFDHVRWYTGTDFNDRLREVGFDVEVVTIDSSDQDDRHVLSGPGVADWFVIARPGH